MLLFAAIVAHCSWFCDVFSASHARKQNSRERNFLMLFRLAFFLFISAQLLNAQARKWDYERQAHQWQQDFPNLSPSGILTLGANFDQ